MLMTSDPLLVKHKILNEIQDHMMLVYRVPHELSAGVPQGSLLGPILEIAHHMVNDDC